MLLSHHRQGDEILEDYGTFLDESLPWVDKHSAPGTCLHVSSRPLEGLCFSLLTGLLFLCSHLLCRSPPAVTSPAGPSLFAAAAAQFAAAAAEAVIPHARSLPVVCNRSFCAAAAGRGALVLLLVLLPLLVDRFICLLHCRTSSAPTLPRHVRPPSCNSVLSYLVLSEDLSITDLSITFTTRSLSTISVCLRPTDFGQSKKPSSISNGDGRAHSGWRFVWAARVRGHTQEAGGDHCLSLSFHRLSPSFHRPLTAFD